MGIARNSKLSTQVSEGSSRGKVVDLRRGTGGGVNPALSIQQALADRMDAILWVAVSVVWKQIWFPASIFHSSRFPLQVFTV